MPSFRIRSFRYCASALLAVLALPCYPPGAQGQTNDQTPAANQPSFGIKVASNLVVVRVVVRDAQGKPVEGLRKEDFKLFDLGKEQPITQFEVEGSLPPPSSSVATHAPAQAGTPPPPALPAKYLALYFDDLNTSDADIIQVREAADHYLAANLQPADRVAIFTSGKMLTDFTSDPKQIHEALSKLQASPRAVTRIHDCPQMSDLQALQITQTENQDIDAWKLAMDDASGCFASGALRNSSTSTDTQNQSNSSQLTVAALFALAERNEIRMQAQSIVAQTEVQTRSDLGQLERVVKYTSQMPGQRNVLLVSPGFLSETEQYQVERIIDEAARLQVVISSLDPKGLAVLLREADASGRYTASTSGAMLGAAHCMDTERELAATGVLEEIAQGTGGEYFHNNNDLTAGFRRIAGSPPSYILAFAPKNLKPDGRFHTLKVTLAEKQTGYSVQARRGYFAPRNEAEVRAEAKELEASDAVDQAQEQIREALLSKTDIAQFPVGLDDQVSQGQGAARELTLISRVEPKLLHFHKEGDHNLNTLTFVFGVFDQKENLVVAQQRHASMNILDGQLPDFLKAGVNVDMTFQLKPGSYRIREVVTDSEDHRITAFSRNIEIPVAVPATQASSLPPPLPPQTTIQPPITQASSLPPPLPPPAPAQPAATPSTPQPAVDQLLLRVWGNYLGYLSSIPNIFADEHVVSSMTIAGNGPAPKGLQNGEIDSTIDSVFRLKRSTTNGKTVDLAESREMKFIDQHKAAKDQRLTGPAILTGAFSRAPNVLSPQFKDCYDYHLLPNLRHNPDVAALLRHSDVLVLEYALKPSLPTNADCPLREQTTGRAFIDPSSMQIVRLEQQRPQHIEAVGLTVAWSWSIDYARVMLNGKPFWLPKTISSKASSLAGRKIEWHFLGTYSHYHLMTVTVTVTPNLKDLPRN